MGHFLKDRTKRRLDDDLDLFVFLVLDDRNNLVVNINTTKTFVQSVCAYVHSPITSTAQGQNHILSPQGQERDV